MGAQHDTGATFPRSPGRPRLYEPDAERDRILNAAIEVLRRNAGKDATIADILAKAGVSTRAFYRHYKTKEDVVRAIYARDAEIFGSRVRRAVEMAGDPLTALRAWVNEVLGVAYDRRRSERMSFLTSSLVFRVVAGTEAQVVGDELHAQPLRKVLEDGLASGVFPDAQPEFDIHTIRAITWETVKWARTDAIALTRREACEYVVRFSLAALGDQSRS